MCVAAGCMYLYEDIFSRFPTTVLRRYHTVVPGHPLQEADMRFFT